MKIVPKDGFYLDMFFTDFSDDELSAEPFLHKQAIKKAIPTVRFKVTYDLENQSLYVLIQGFGTNKHF